jgi:hypothetical protein
VVLCRERPDQHTARDAHEGSDDHTTILTGCLQDLTLCSGRGGRGVTEGRAGGCEEAVGRKDRPLAELYWSALLEPPTGKPSPSLVDHFVQQSDQGTGHRREGDTTVWEGGMWHGTVIRHSRRHAELDSYKGRCNVVLGAANHYRNGRCCC